MSYFLRNRFVIIILFVCLCICLFILLIYLFIYLFIFDKATDPATTARRRKRAAVELCIGDNVECSQSGFCKCKEGYKESNNTCVEQSSKHSHLLSQLNK